MDQTHIKSCRHKVWNSAYCLSAKTPFEGVTIEPRVPEHHWKSAPSPGCTRARRRTIKFHFYQANVFELAIKQRFSPDNEASPHRGVGSFSFFVYSPANWFCGIYASSSRPSSTPLPHLLDLVVLLSRGPQGSRLFWGTQISNAWFQGYHAPGHLLNDL